VTAPKLCVVTVTCNDPAGLRLTLESLRPLFAAGPTLSVGAPCGRRRARAQSPVGLFSTAQRVARDYDYHVRCYLAGLRGRFTTDVLVNYDMTGGSNDIVTLFREFRQIQRSHSDALPTAVNWVNEIVRPAEYARMRSLRRLAATPIGASLRPSWATLNRWLRTGKTCRL
jgi:hypothetical protein